VSAERPIRVEVVVAFPDSQTLITLGLPAGTTAIEALRAASLEEGFPALDMTAPALAVWGRPISNDARLRDGDRLEWLRPLCIDPRAERRELARDGQFMGRAAETDGD
jgi:putative ubiquitin-RnfH superfamily antitoxin RatB of RatAB toxin-antitoxin module